LKEARDLARTGYVEVQLLGQNVNSYRDPSPAGWDFARLLRAMGEIDGAFAPEELAEFLLSSWEGAILRMKVERNGEPLERFKRIAFATTFRDPSK